MSTETPAPSALPADSSKQKAVNKMPVELDTLTDYEKCHSVFRAVCEGIDCELTYDELEALQENGYIENLKMVRKNRWSFEWTDKLRDYATSPAALQEHMLRVGLSNQSD